ncbi:transcription termination factor Rho [Borreliella californiensis]|uniref:Transcription termination factor Rho n=1 Tax=Borreliella californiensis TaxID=373543 RepID=A0A7X0DQ80_9SPIR|nr:transcription termination factor Rho [Borreliella californiensis]MBB6213139.1 transcription termination factor Rho [Borreliella californiensis]WKC91532.1 transcription termination factor Rho [Borreliella californiensis]WNY70288.1 transcription termination factor Rho [Borreliella californiensis]
MDKKNGGFDLESEIRRLDVSKEFKIEDNLKKKVVKVVAKKDSASNLAKSADLSSAKDSNSVVFPEFDYDIPSSGLENNIKTLEQSNIIKFFNGKDYVEIEKLYDKPITEVRKIVEGLGTNHTIAVTMKKTELIFLLVKILSENDINVLFTGVLDVLSDGYGFLRTASNSYLSGGNDVYVSPSQIRLFNLRTGDILYGQIRSPRDGERFFAMVKIKSINDQDPTFAQNRIPFDNLTPLYPNMKLNLEYENCNISTRLINLFSPIGKGQRALIVSPPKAGKTTLLQKIANAITTNYSDVILMILLIDERPEEVTDMIRSVKGEVIASNFDEQASRHVQVAEMVIEKAKRLVENKKDVVILLDSITRLARAYNQTMPTSGKILSGGVDSNALHKPKRFFGSARNIEEGGSLTIIATALVDTGSKMDEVIFEEFKSTGNMELILDRSLADRRLFPAINIKKSGTRKEELLLSEEERSKILLIRRILGGVDDYEGVEVLIEKMKKSKNNEIFLKTMSNGN